MSPKTPVCMNEVETDRQLVYVMWTVLVLFSSSEDQAAGARCSHQEPSKLRPLWGKVLLSSACSLWSPGGIEGASCMYESII